MLGMPIVGLATTEVATTIENGVSGYVDNDIDRLVDVMQLLLRDPTEARRWGHGARAAALEKFHISRFVRDWERTFASVVDRRLHASS
jgi:glycosyltransferase involved in cell wall biosynthesis